MSVLKKQFAYIVIAAFAFSLLVFSYPALAACPYSQTPVQCEDSQALARGAKCQRVCDLQDKLKDSGYYFGAIDGEYGQQTADGVTNFQVTLGLEPDGIAGSRTLSALGLTVPVKASNDNVNIPDTPDSVNQQQNNAVNQQICPPKYVRVGPTCVPENTGSGPAGVKTLTELIAKVINYLLYFSGTIAVLFIIIGGFWYMTSSGNEEQAEKGQKTLLNAVIGLVLIVMAYVIVNIVVNTLTSGSGTTGTGTNSSANTSIPGNVQYDPNNPRTIDQ